MTRSGRITVALLAAILLGSGSAEAESIDQNPGISLQELCWHSYGERYAIIVMGGNELSSGQLYRWYWGDTHGMYTALVGHSFTDRNIHFLS